MKELKTKIFCSRSFVAIFILFQVFQSAAQVITPPTCYGGQRQLREYIRQEIIYPETALQEGKEGTVELSFTVKTDGTISNLEVSKSVSPEIDAEAIRLFNHILWHPARELGRSIDYRHSIQIRFRIKSYLRQNKSRDASFFTIPHQPVDTGFKVYDPKNINYWPRSIFSSADRNLSNFLLRNLVYPEAAFRRNISGTVKLRFVVEVTGRISNIEVIEPVGGGCTEEAIRVAKLISWYPGFKGKTAVRAFMSLEITFDISGKHMGGDIPTPGQVH